MKYQILAAAALTLCFGDLSACASYYGESGYTYYDGYYDNFYGPVSYGYWGDDDYYYYTTVRGRPYVRDDAHHFRRDAAEGWRRFHMRGQRPGDQHRDGRR